MRGPRARCRWTREGETRRTHPRRRSRRRAKQLDTVDDEQRAAALERPQRGGAQVAPSQVRPRHGRWSPRARRIDRIHVAPAAWCTFEAAGFAVITFVPQIAVADLDAEELPSYHRNVDNDESVFVHHDAGSARKPGTLSHVPQGILHGADEATRAAFQAKRVPGMRRTLCGVSVDTDKPLIVSPTFEWLSAG